MKKIAYQPLVALCLVVACGVTREADSGAILRSSDSAISCVADGLDSARYRVTEQGLFYKGSPAASRPILPAWGEVDVEVDHNGASTRRVAALLEGRTIGHVEVDENGRAVLVVLDSLVSTAARVSPASSVACIVTLWSVVRAEADEGGVYIWRDQEGRITYRLDRVLLSGDEGAPVAARLNPEARVAAVLIALDSVPIGARSRLVAPRSQ